MIDLKALLKPDQGQPATLLHLVDKKGFEAWLKDQPARTRKAVEAQGFKGEGFQLAILPGERGDWRWCWASPMSRRSAPGAWPRRRKACPKAATALPARVPASPCSAGCSASINSSATRRSRPRRARGCC